MLILILVMNAKFVRPVFSNIILTGLAGVFGVASMVFCLYNVYMDEPMLDFRPYAIGQNIIENMTEKQHPVMKMTYVYRDKTTKLTKEYPSTALSDTNVLKELANMEYVTRRDEVLDEGKPAKITNLFMQDEDGNNMNDSIFHYSGYSLMVVSQNLGKTHTEAFKQLDELAAACDKAHIKFFAVVVNDNKIDDFRHKYNAAFPFYYADETPLKTMIRSNPGLILLKNGTIINKWHYRHLPAFEELSKAYFEGK